MVANKLISNYICLYFLDSYEFKGFQQVKEIALKYVLINKVT